MSGALILATLLAACGDQPASLPEVTVEPAAQAAPEHEGHAAAAEHEGHGADAGPQGVDEGEGWVRYGAEFSVEQPLEATALLADPAAFVDQTVRVSGRVADVCQKAGCWLVLSEGDKLMRVTMKAHDFGVAKDGAGSACEVEGTVVAQKLEAERTEHFKSESPEGAALPEEQASGEVVYEIVATAVRMKRAEG